MVVQHHTIAKLLVSDLTCPGVRFLSSPLGRPAKQHERIVELVQPTVQWATEAWVAVVQRHTDRACPPPVCVLTVHAPLSYMCTDRACLPLISKFGDVISKFGDFISKF